MNSRARHLWFGALRPAASGRLLRISTTSAGVLGPRASNSARRLLPRPEIATAIRSDMAGKVMEGGGFL